MEGVFQCVLQSTVLFFVKCKWIFGNTTFSCYCNMM